jgi:hypothetical protein
MVTELPLLDPSKRTMPTLAIRGEYDGIATEADGRSTSSAASPTSIPRAGRECSRDDRIDRPHRLLPR